MSIKTDTEIVIAQEYDQYGREQPFFLVQESTTKYEVDDVTGMKADNYLKLVQPIIKVPYPE